MYICRLLLLTFDGQDHSTHDTRATAALEIRTVVTDIYKSTTSALLVPHYLVVLVTTICTGVPVYWCTGVY